MPSSPAQPTSHHTGCLGREISNRSSSRVGGGDGDNWTELRGVGWWSSPCRHPLREASQDGRTRAGHIERLDGGVCVWRGGSGGLENEWTVGVEGGGPEGEGWGGAIGLKEGEGGWRRDPHPKCRSWGPATSD